MTRLFCFQFHCRGPLLLAFSFVVGSVVASPVFLGSPGGGGTAASGLRQGSYRAISDSKGNSWNVQQNGQLGRGNNSMWSNGMQLFINNDQFYNYQPMMTADGKEYVLAHHNPQQFSGLQVTRRIRVMEKEGAVRFLDILENPTQQDMTVFAEIRNGFGTRAKIMLSNSAQQNPTQLARRDYGLMVIPNSTSSSYRTVLITACAPDASIKPSINFQNNYQLSFNYQLTVPAGGKVCLMHIASQCKTPKDRSAKALSKIFKPLLLRRYLRSIPQEYRAFIVNGTAGNSGGGENLLPEAALARLNVQRGSSDVLALGTQTRLIGKASCAGFTLDTAHGTSVIPFEEIAAILGAGGASGQCRAILRDGQILSGEAEAEGLRFVLPSGARIDLSLKKLDRLVRARTEDEGIWGEEISAMIETYEGDRLNVKGSYDANLSLLTPYGVAKFSIDDVLWLSPPDDETVGHEVAFKDGTRIFGFLSSEEVTVDTQLFGPKTWEGYKIRAIATSAFVRETRERRSRALRQSFGAPAFNDPLSQQPHVRLVGGQRFAGRINSPTVAVLTSAESIELSPANIRRLYNLRDELSEEEASNAPFQIDLWGGSVVVGHMRETVLPVLFRGEVWQVPVSDVVEVVTPSPQISDETRQEIAAHIRDLGNEDWEKREESSRALGEFGFLARSMLMEAMRVSPDPEVRRRVEKLLDVLD